MQNEKITLTKPPYSLLWDEGDLIFEKSQDLLRSGIAGTESEAFEMASLDQEMLEFEYEDFLETFGSILSEISVESHFWIVGRNMGWRHLSGSLDLIASDARDFIEKAFPKTSQWTLRGFFDSKTKILTYTLSHHDAPTGESYTVRAAEKSIEI